MQVRHDCMYAVSGSVRKMTDREGRGGRGKEGNPSDSLGAEHDSKISLEVTLLCKNAKVKANSEQQQVLREREGEVRGETTSQLNRKMLACFHKFLRCRDCERHCVLTKIYNFSFKYIFCPRVGMAFLTPPCVQLKLFDHTLSTHPTRVMPHPPPPRLPGGQGGG